MVEFLHIASEGAARRNEARAQRECATMELQSLSTAARRRWGTRKSFSAEQRKCASIDFTQPRDRFYCVKLPIRPMLQHSRKTEKHDPTANLETSLHTSKARQADQVDGATRTAMKNTAGVPTICRR
jgi:hypothetical protein